MNVFGKVCYVLGIAIAVGIGMNSGLQAESDFSGKAGTCTQKVSFLNCSQAKCGTRPVSQSGNSVKDCVANFVPNGYCLSSDDADCSDSSPTLSCNTDCE